MVSRHSTTKGRAVESAGTRRKSRVQPEAAIARPRSGWGGGRYGSDPLPALGRARPLVSRSRCPDTYELLNKSMSLISLKKVAKLSPLYHGFAGERALLTSMTTRAIQDSRDRFKPDYKITSIDHSSRTHNPNASPAQLNRPTARSVRRSLRRPR